MDLVPGFADRVHILRDPRYNVAYWNLAQRNLAKNGDEWQIEGRPLGFFHFSGFDCTMQNRLSRFTAAFRGDGISAPLRALMRHYTSQVLMNGYREARRISYGYDRFTSGVPIPDQARRVFRTQYVHWLGDPFTYFKADVPPLGAAPVPAMTAEEMICRIEDIYASTSWRITRPLRAVKRLLCG